ncbi:hypothetical protein OR16_34683 [Cupriavidus basilensis OR16]|uniref:Uncharacterized protein n=1 Tax=Cupriavidus basilensis OR16 TaxID=1127483 RepID=H1SF35_9BURK|nr:hypothetical protein [Cupriavidus basilensis]EHP38860.1 hypothetical protein OR16_34683 [Cupriavidus basilensis OR16]
MEQVQNIRERVLAGQVLVAGVGKTSASLDGFSGWLLAGSAAASTFLLSHLDVVTAHVAAACVRWFFALFFVSGALGIFAKFLAALISGATSASSLGFELGKQVDLKTAPFDFAVFLDEASRALFWPGRLFVGWMFAKVLKGDLAVSGRMIAKIGQVQGLMVILQALVAVGSVAVLAAGVQG